MFLNYIQTLVAICFLVVKKCSVSTIEVICIVNIYLLLNIIKH